MEMTNHEGRCRYCGSIQPVLASDQDDANERISHACECGGYQKEVRHKRMIKNIEETFGEQGINRGLQQVPTEQMAIIKQAAEAIFEEHISNVTIGLINSTAKISMTAKGNIKIERSFTKKVQVES